MRSAVRLAAMIPARRAVATTSPFFAVPERASASVAGCMTMRPSATGEALRHRLVRHVDHMGGAARVEVGEARHEAAASVWPAISDSPRSWRVAAATSACRIRLSPTRKVAKPDWRSRRQSAWREDAALADEDAIVRHLRREALGDGERDVEAAEVAVVDAEQRRVEPKRALQLGLVVHLDEHVHRQRLRRAAEVGRRRVVEAGHDEQDAIRPVCARLGHLVALEHEVLAQHRQAGRRARGFEKGEAALEGGAIGQHRQAGRAAGLVGGGQRRRIEVGADEAFGRARLLDLGDQRESARRGAWPAGPRRSGAAAPGLRRARPAAPQRHRAMAAATSRRL